MARARRQERARQAMAPAALLLVRHAIAVQEAPGVDEPLEHFKRSSRLALVSARTEEKD